MTGAAHAIVPARLRNLRRSTAVSITCSSKSPPTPTPSIVTISPPEVYPEPTPLIHSDLVTPLTDAVFRSESIRFPWAAFSTVVIVSSLRFE